jgi:hypothetical protein
MLDPWLDALQAVKSAEQVAVAAGQMQRRDSARARLST